MISDNRAGSKAESFIGSVENIDNRDLNMRFPGKNPISNVTVDKVIEPGSRGPRIRITIKAPDLGPANEIKNDIVIALDTSGSFGKGGIPEHGVVIREVMPDILMYIKEKDPNCNISLLSWDDNIDFVYGPNKIDGIVNKDINKAMLMPIGIAIRDIFEENVFDPPSHEISLLKWSLNLTEFRKFLPLSHPIEGYNEGYIHFWENESTDLNVGLEGALKILNDANGIDTNRKFILLITGKSEFIELNDLIRSEIDDKKYKIFVVGLGVSSGSQLNKTLTEIANANNGMYLYSPGIVEWTEDSICDVIESAIEDIINSEVINNITINESLYPYLRISSIALKKNNAEVAAEISHIRNPADNTTMVELEWRKPLNASEKLEIIIDTELNMSLPVEVSESRARVLYSIDQGTGPSLITYYWQNRTKFMVELPERRVT